ncbi:MAG: hypothetical protein E6778_16500 [Niallia nealsonii]|nr:hypothetical protein [Niallia nealsonii]
MRYKEMKYNLKDIVSFEFKNEKLVGKIEIRDFGGSFEHDYHSYDVYVEEDNCLYKHIKESDLTLIERYKD